MMLEFVLGVLAGWISLLMVLMIIAMKMKK